MVAFFAALPMWVKVGAGMGLLLGIMQVVNWWNTRDLKRDLANAQQTLKITQEESAKAAAEYAINAEREEANRLELELEIDKQNRRINSIAAQAREAQSTATLAALRAQAEGSRIAEELRKTSSEVPPGPESMNEWLRKRVGGK